jgi:hypothetical protein
VAVCPAGAITHTKIPNKVPLKKTGKLPTHEAVVNLVESRRSVRVFKDEKVSEDAIAKLLDLVNYIPTGHASRTNIRIEIIQNKEIW